MQKVYSNKILCFERCRADVCMESGDTLIVRPLPNSESPDPMSEMTGTNTRTNMAIVFPGDLVELVSESISESVSHHACILF